MPIEGILPIHKPQGKTSFQLVARLRKLFHVQTIGHAGTLDPLATGVMVLLIGKRYTTQANRFLMDDKEYVAQITLGVTTDSFDAEGVVLSTNETLPSEEQLREALKTFQGEVLQVPPMFSAKKRQGKPLYLLARQGIEVPRDPVAVRMQCTWIDYTTPHLLLHVQCSKGTYVRSLAHDLGQNVGCGAHLSALKRVRSGAFRLADCCPGEALFSETADLATISRYIQKELP